MKRHLTSIFLLIFLAVSAHAVPPGATRCQGTPQFAAGTISGPATVCVGTTVTFSATVPVDYDTCDDNRQQELDNSVGVIQWNYGDGTSDASGSHLYTNCGTYIVTAVYDDSGTKGDDSPVTSNAIQVTITPNWSVGTPIQCPNGITSPVYGVRVAPGEALIFTCGTATDNDTKTCNTATTLVDTCTYSWTANGGTFPSGGTGTSVTWTAPATSGTYNITVTIDDQNDQNKGSGDCGTRNDPTISFTAYVFVCTHAHPVNLRQIEAYAVPLSSYSTPPVGGYLYFRYAWDSSVSGSNVSDLTTVTCGEHVRHPGNQDPFAPPDPPFSYWPQPLEAFVLNVEGTEGQLQDKMNFPRYGFMEPPTAASFTAWQEYIYNCTECMSLIRTEKIPGNSGPFYITRSVAQVDFIGDWYYEVSSRGINYRWDIYFWNP